MAKNTAIMEPDIVLKNGKPKAVILDIREYKELLEKVEDVEDLSELKKLRKNSLKFRKFNDLWNSGITR